MKNFAKLVFLLTCFLFSIPPTAHAYDPSTRHLPRVYFDSNDLEVSDNIFYIHVEDYLIETTIVRTDAQGLYIFESDITNYEVVQEKKWK